MVKECLAGFGRLLNVTVKSSFLRAYWLEVKLMTDCVVNVIFPTSVTVSARIVLELLYLQ